MNSSEQHSYSNGLIAWFSHNPVAANILMFVLLVGGLVSISNMRVETFPSIDPKLITVVVPYPGGTPLEIADSITSRVEEGLIGIDGVKRISAVASEGYGAVNVELEDFADGDDVLTEVENTVNSLSDFPPANAERPVITKIKATPNVLSLAVHGDASEETIKYWTEHIESELKQLPAVALTSVRGIRDYQISIEVSEHNLRRHNLSLLEIGNIISSFSIDASAGTIESSQGEIILRVQDKSYEAEEFRNIVLSTLDNGATLRLGDVATVIDGFEDINLISKFNGERAAFIDISRNESEDTLTVADQVKNYLVEAHLPEGIHVSIQRDETIALEDRINLMLRNGLVGFVLVFLVLLLFLDLKLAFWTSVAIPVSFLGGILMINFLGYSINMISLFALIVVLGIVVDDAIVTGESIFDAHQRHKGAEDSTMKGVYAVMAPVIIGVSTTMAAFAPLMYSTGVLGQIIKVIPVVVISILLISLFEAFFILPSHLSSPKRWSKGIMASIRDKFSSALFYFVDHILIPFARFTIKWRYATLTAFMCLAIITAGMFSAGIVRFVFFPQVEADEVTINVTMPKGIPFALTQETMLRIEQVALDLSKELTVNDVAPFKSLS
ncbi:MAG: efflux RND transporter permease subunit, partial [Bdellovibrionales bacterium]